MPRLTICSRDLHWQWINWALLYDTMVVSMLRLAWLTIAQHVFQPALTCRLGLISRKNCLLRTGDKGYRGEQISRKKLSPANWIKGVTAISRKISRSLAPKNGVQHATAIYPIPRFTRPRYIGSTLYFVQRDLEIWWMTLENNRAPLLYYIKLCASFQSHGWIQTGVTVRKRTIWVKIGNFLSRVTLKFDGWPWKSIGHLSYAASSFVRNFVPIGEFKLELQSGNAQSGSNTTIFNTVWPWNLTDDLEKQ